MEERRRKNRIRNKKRERDGFWKKEENKEVEEEKE